MFLKGKRTSNGGRIGFCAVASARMSRQIRTAKVAMAAIIKGLDQGSTLPPAPSTNIRQRREATSNREPLQSKVASKSPIRAVLLPGRLSSRDSLFAGIHEYTKMRASKEKGS